MEEILKQFPSSEQVLEKNWSEFVVAGDIHGYLESAQMAVETGKELELPVVFLGDYVDRGNKQLETLKYLLEQANQEDVVLLRGNHESVKINRRYGFLRKYRISGGSEKTLESFYNKLPLALITEQAFLVHGGPPFNSGLDKLDEEAREDMLWSDPDPRGETTKENYYRGAGKLYGRRAVVDFLNTHHLDFIIRGHQRPDTGHRSYFDRQLITLFSAPDYRRGKKGQIAVIRGQKVEYITV